MVISIDVDTVPTSYRERRDKIASLAAGLDAPPTVIDYTDVEHGVWTTVAASLEPLWEHHASAGVLEARDGLGLPVDRVPQLVEVHARLRPLTGFGYRAVPGLLPAGEFFEALSRRLFASTQYLRWEGSPLYTPEPDVIHEVLGHANCLACPEIAELHRMTGEVVGRLQDGRARLAIADVFWFTVEFGVVREHGASKAYGAGLLSSPGELEWFGEHADIRPIDIAAMATTTYDINHYQPVLFEAHSLQHVVDVVGNFYETATDESISRLLAANSDGLSATR
jgi:phenylalanine-4-hydroxylase